MGAERILVVRLSAVGDCVHAIPAVRALRAALPDSHIAWAVDDRAAPLLTGMTEVNEFLVMPRRALRGASRLTRWRRLAAFRRQLRQRDFTAAVDFQGLAKSALTAYLSGAPLRVGFPRGEGSREFAWALYNSRPDIPDSAVHVSEKCLRLLVPLGVSPAVPLPEPRLPGHPAAAERVAAALAGLGLDEKPFAVLNPGAGWSTKLWPAGHYAQLAAGLRGKLGIEVLVSWFGPSEERLAAGICAGSGARPAPRTDLPELTELLRRATLFVGSDTGPTHIAAALGVPTVALFGAADPMRNRPLGRRVAILCAGLDCSPCWRRSGCPRGGECMSRIRPESVLAAARRLEAVR
jgi:heptosyltransferase-1